MCFSPDVSIYFTRLEYHAVGAEHLPYACAVRTPPLKTANRWQNDQSRHMVNDAISTFKKIKCYILEVKVSPPSDHLVANSCPTLTTHFWARLLGRSIL